jgi:hypothetical protein
MIGSWDRGAGNSANKQREREREREREKEGSIDFSDPNGVKMMRLESCDLCICVSTIFSSSMIISEVV